MLASFRLFYEVYLDFSFYVHLCIFHQPVANCYELCHECLLDNFRLLITC